MQYQDLKKAPKSILDPPNNMTGKELFDPMYSFHRSRDWDTELTYVEWKQ